MTEDEFDRDMDAISDIVYEQVVPILDKIEEEYPDHSAYFNVFINSMHVVFEQGWTKEELLQEVEDHYDLFVKNAALEQSQLH